VIGALTGGRITGVDVRLFRTIRPGRPLDSYGNDPRDAFFYDDLVAAHERVTSRLRKTLPLMIL
jgi:hypothetical protein